VKKLAIRSVIGRSSDSRCHDRLTAWIGDNAVFPVDITDEIVVPDTKILDQICGEVV